MTLYELTDNFKSLKELLESGEIDEQTFNDTVESFNADIEEKAEGYSKIVREFEAEAAGAKAEIDRLTAVKQTAENNIKRLKANLLEAMQAQGKNKIKAGTFTVSIAKNAPSVNILDEEKIPKEYYRTPDPELSKKALLADLKAGKKIDGVETKQTVSLRIR